LATQAWGVIKALSTLDDFLNLDRDIEGSPKRWKKLVDSEAPEKEKLPQEWKTNRRYNRCAYYALFVPTECLTL